MAIMYYFERKTDERRLKSGVKNVDSGFNVLLPGSTGYEKSKLVVLKKIARRI